MTKDEIIRQYNSLALAYIGDAAYELAVREHILKNGITVNGEMHRAAKRFVSAAAQTEMLKKLTDVLTEDEASVVRRGRNAKSHSHPKNADLSDYHNATGFEALWGYLYLSGDTQRMNELFEIIVK